MDFDHSVETISPDNLTYITIGGTGALIIPSGTTAQRPAVANGLLRYNTDTATLDLVVSGAYRTIATNVTLATTGITAAGATQGTATSITAGVNNVTTVTALSGVILLTPIAGDSITVVNNGANPLAVYPAVGGSIDNLATNAPQTLAVDKVLTLVAVTSTLWEILADTGASGGSGAVSSVTGTASQVTVSPTTGATVVSLVNTGCARHGSSNR